MPSTVLWEMAQEAAQHDDEESRQQKIMFLEAYHRKVADERKNQRLVCHGLMVMAPFMIFYIFDL